ncbi:uncharacterized protein [Solanum lycopersicum]|uniref:uncharacterized protein n=1 Tax=Solanum lycopersicum TaxID=4081 RepID=UPI0037497F27
MQKTEEDEFIYLFVALRPFIRGFDYCRPIVVVDGAHLIGAYKGTFVSASTLDWAVKAYTKEDFDKLMAKVDRVDHRVKEYLEDVGYEKWSRVHATVVSSSKFIFSDYEAGRRYIICLERKICSCERFQLEEIPCGHAITVLKEKNVKDMHPYCSDYYKPDALVKTYEIPKIPMSDKIDWSSPKNMIDETVYPLRHIRLYGRSRKRRKKKSR